MSKANKDGWIRHRGGKCPVDGYESVEIRKRNGMTDTGTAGVFSWKHHGFSGEVMAYRLHKPEQVEPAENTFTVTLSNGGMFEVGEKVHIQGLITVNPLQWRDRIREIDAERDSAEAAHRAEMEKLDSEREQLIERLKSEGFALIGKVAEPAEDMSDPHNWKRGDLIRFVKGTSGKCFTHNQLYRFEEVDQYGAVHIRCDDEGDPNGWNAEFFKWYSRPTA